MTKAEAVVSEAQNILKNANHKIWRDGEKACKGTKRLASKLKQQLQLTDRIITQSKEVISGNRIIPNRLVSLFDPDARPIVIVKNSVHGNFLKELR